ncbi:segregation and condensation protein A [Weissella uvarum]|uniref:segregation/condensation protein A n=1 Tax=Weissella uvarum TaxID=1479233 RepID=UPI001960AA7B|nr:segregation/condensation protein A [Weissella uvarum]MBM7617075.1 segregation and condensation protein A [Weissella uvarum]MCM0595373.1 segregation/condensation protein A [Weissella uvarum]
MSETLNYHLEDFDGPLDLLLHLIRVNEMDIFDIQIVEITQQYLEFIHQAEERNLDIAGDFLVMAANLMAIKSNDLLPTMDPVDDDLANVVDEPDPKADLMQQLLEYQQYQAAATQLREMEEDRQLQFSRAPETVDPLADEQTPIPTPVGLQIADLQQAFAKLLDRRQLQVDKQKMRSLAPARPSIEHKMTHIMDQFATTPRLTFEALFAEHQTKADVIVTFLGVLELVRHQQLAVQQDANFDEIILEKQELSE